MDSIRIQRLRCLSDTGDIDIKPITILVGQNSSGKSSFLRVFPLLRQSVESRTVGPILWNGRLVDFGTYKDAHQKNSENGILFSFKFQFDSRTINIQLKVLEDQEKQTTITDELIIKDFDSSISISFDQQNNKIKKFYVNSLNILELGDRNYRFDKNVNKNFLPSIYEEKIDKDLEIEKIYKQSNFKRIFFLLKQEVKGLNAGNTSNETIDNMIESFQIGDSQFMLENIKHNTYGKKTWQKNTSNLTINSPEFQKLRDLIIAKSVPEMLLNFDILLGMFAKNISYMGPVRATAERYYRSQDLAVDEVDYRGNNLAMFLRNLTSEEKVNWQNWIYDNFQVKPDIETAGGNISLKIYTNNSHESFNITDTGFGYSQILPIITQLWFLCEFKPNLSQQHSLFFLNYYMYGFEYQQPQPLTFAIEQPELHLHPRLQAILTETFVKAIKIARKKGINLRLILETHSNTLINKLGELVAEEKISNDDINIVIFEPSEESGNAKVRTAKFDNEGYLSEDWPLGFLS
jgi:predicted ATPase